MKTTKQYLWEHVRPDLYTFFMKNYQLLCESYWDISHIIYKFLNKRRLDLFFDKQDKNIPWKEQYNILNDLLCNDKQQEVNSLIYRSIKANSKIVTYEPPDNYPIATDYAKKMVESVYPVILKKLKRQKSAHSLKDFYSRVEFFKQVMIKEFPNLNGLEYKVLSENANLRYKKIMDSFKKKIYNKELNFDEKAILEQINNFVKQNIYKLFSKTRLKTDENNTFYQSWLDPYGNLDGTEQDVLKHILLDNSKQLCNDLNIDKAYIDELIDKYIQIYGSSWEQKIYDLISVKNTKQKKERGLNLLNKDDSIGSETKIDYDITADHVRTKPIIIIQDANTKENYVMFGPNGSSHGFYIQNKLLSDAQNKNIDIDPYKMGYGYLLGSIVFVDKNPDNNQFGFTNNEVLDILKNDPRINKVYQTSSHPMPGGGIIKRLAKIIK